MEKAEKEFKTYIRKSQERFNKVDEIKYQYEIERKDILGTFGASRPSELNQTDRKKWDDIIAEKKLIIRKQINDIMEADKLQVEKLSENEFYLKTRKQL